MNSNRSSNQGQGKAKGKNRPNKTQKRKAEGPPNASQPSAPKRARGNKGRQTSVAAAYATGQTGKGATVTASRDSCRVVHREFVGNVSGTTAFTIAQQLALNPGLSASFPWLAGIAQNWETYRFNRLRLCYYTRTGSNVPGSVIMAHDPDASDAAPSTEQVMTTYEACEEDAPWKDICLEFRKSALHDLGPRKFVRTGALAANQDIKLYDSGNAFVATVDGTAVSWGKLWFEYDIELFTPQLPPTGAFQGGVISSAATTAASPMLNGVSQGAISITQNLTAFTASGLVVGNEYYMTYCGTTMTGGITFTSLVGMTLKSTFDISTVVQGYTFTATASNVSWVTNPGTVGVNVMLIIIPLPTLAF